MPEYSTFDGKNSYFFYQTFEIFEKIIFRHFLEINFHLFSFENKRYIKLYQGLLAQKLLQNLK